MLTLFQVLITDGVYTDLLAPPVAFNACSCNASNYGFFL